MYILTRDLKRDITYYVVFSCCFVLFCFIFIPDFNEKSLSFSRNHWWFQKIDAATFDALFVFICIPSIQRSV